MPDPTRISSVELKHNLSECLDRVLAGERLAITRHGRVVGLLLREQPPEPDPTWCQRLRDDDRCVRCNRVLVNTGIEIGGFLREGAGVRLFCADCSPEFPCGAS